VEVEPDVETLLSAFSEGVACSSVSDVDVVDILLTGEERPLNQPKGFL
jgi:hypothetical protein